MSTRNPADLPVNGDDIARYLAWHSALARPGVDALEALHDLFGELVWDAHLGGALTLSGAHERLADALALLRAATDRAR